MINERIPTGTKVNFIAASYKETNFKLTVANVRQKNNEDIGGILPEDGQISESVENKGNLKGKTKHSSWNKKATMIDSHAIPRSLVCGGASGSRFFISEETIASQLFIYKDKEVSETVIPNSGFTIRYTNKVFKSDGTLVKALGKIPVEIGMYSILEIQKSPSKVKVNKQESEAGTGGTEVIRWKIEQPETGTLVWKVTEINPLKTT